jgi:hypothetical protein
MCLGLHSGLGLKFRVATAVKFELKQERSGWYAVWTIEEFPANFAAAVFRGVVSALIIKELTHQSNLCAAAGF